MKKVNIIVLLVVILSLTTSLLADVATGNALLKEKKYAEAREEFQKALPELKGLQASDIQNQIGYTYYKENKFKEAIEEYEKTLQIEGGRASTKANALTQIARLLITPDKNYEGAREAYKRIFEIEGLRDYYKARAQYLISTTYFTEKNYKETISEAKKALEMEGIDDSTKSMAFLFIGRAQKAEKNYKEALEAYLEFETLLKNEAYLPEVRSAIGEIYFIEEKYPQAREKFTQIISAEKASKSYKSLSHLKLAQSYLAEKNNEKALEEFKILVEAPYVQIAHKRTVEKTIKELTEN